MPHLDPEGIIDGMEDTLGTDSNKKTTVLLVEDHVSLREALALMFDREPDFEVIGQASSMTEAREALGKADLTIIDLGLPDGDGTDLIRDLNNLNASGMAGNEGVALVLTASLDRSLFARAVEAGAAGVLHKSAAVSEIIRASRRIRAGETLLSPTEIVEMLRLASAKREKDVAIQMSIKMLTPREKEVLQAFAEGLDSKGIARRLNIAVETERNYTTSILGKLGVHSRLQALVFAIRYGVVEIPATIPTTGDNGQRQTII